LDNRKFPDKFPPQRGPGHPSGLGGYEWMVRGLARPFAARLN